MTTAPRVRKVHQVAAEQLRKRILSGELRPGDRLPPEEQLTAELDIARTTLREALRVLESQGLLRIQRGRRGGPIVTHPDLQPAATALAISLRLQATTVGDLADANRLIEPQLAGRMAADHLPADLAALRLEVDRAAIAADAGDGIAFGAASAAVHQTLIERSGNRTLATISLLLNELVKSYYADLGQATTPELMQLAVRSYRRLLGLIEDGDVEGAIAHWDLQLGYTMSSTDHGLPLSAKLDLR